MAADIEYLIDPKITQEVVDAKNKLKQQADRAEDILDSLKDGAGSGTGGGIEEAPEDNDKYVRENGAWVVLPDYPSLPEIIPEAPEDGKTYGRKGGTWAEIDTSGSGGGGTSGSGGGGGGTVSEWGDIQGTLSNQTDLQTALDAKLESKDLGSLSSEDDAPSDGKQYARKDGAWSEVEAGGSGGQSYTPFSWTPTVTKIHLDIEQAKAEGSYGSFTPQILDAFTNNEIKGNVLKIDMDNKESTMHIVIPTPKELGWNVGDQMVLDIGKIITYRKDAFGRLRIRPVGGYKPGSSWGSLRGLYATAAEIEASPFYNPLTQQCTLLLTAKNAKPDGSDMVFHVTPI